MKISGFDWDEGNRNKCQKHGVSIAAIEALFRSPHTILPNPEHSRNEERFIAIGKATPRRHVFLVYTLRKRGEAVLIRPISARYMHQKEVAYYEKEIAKIEKR